MIPIDQSAFRPKVYDPPIQRSYRIPEGLLALLEKIAKAEKATVPYLVRRFCEQLEMKWEPKPRTRDDERFLAAVKAGMSASSCSTLNVWLRKSTTERLEECARFYGVSRSLLVTGLVAEAVRKYSEFRNQPEFRVDLVKLELLPKLEKDQAAA